MIYIILAIVVVLLLLLVLGYNSLVRSRNQVDEAWADIDTQLQRRHDLIPNLVETVKGYATHERETLQAVIAARQTAVAARQGGPAAAGQAETALNRALGGVFALAENYPQLRAVEGFTSLQAQLQNTEDQISASRRIYNGNVQAYMTKRQSFPAVLYASAFGFGPRELFEASDEAVREPVKVSFS